MQRIAGWKLAAVLAATTTTACDSQRLDGGFLPLSIPLPPEQQPDAQQPLAAVDGRRDGGPLLLGRHAGKTLALIADRDARALRVTAGDGSLLAERKLAGEPAQLVIAGDGRLYASLRDANELAVLELSGSPPTLRQVAALPTAAEPIGVSVTPDGNTVLVASGWGGALEAFDVRTRDLRWRRHLGHEPRSVVVTDDGAGAWVSHLRGSQLSYVSLGAGEPVHTAALGGDDRLTSTVMRGGGCVRRRERVTTTHPRDLAQGFALTQLDGRVFAPMVIVHRGRATVTAGYGSTAEVGFPANQPAIATVEGADRAVELRVARDVFDTHTGQRRFTGFDSRGCLLPRAAAADAARRAILVSCLGTDEVIAYRTELPRDGHAPPTLRDTELARWRVAPGAVGLAVDSAAGRAFVWSQFARALSILALPDSDPDADPKRPTEPRQPHATRQLAPLSSEQTLSAAAARGRILFHSAADPRISADGRACASCHPDGRDDGLTWPSPNGPRQTPTLAGRLIEQAAPYGWQGEHETIEAHLADTLKRLRGRGLEPADLSDLVSYLRELPLPPAPPRSPDSALLARGQELFHSELVGCSTCHTQAIGSDGARHAVGSGPELETPSLRLVAGTGPYWHDGRYATLAELLTDTRGVMGWGADLGEPDLRALEAYLSTL